MAKVTYTPTDTADQMAFCTVYGITFVPGQPQEIDDDVKASGLSSVTVVEKLRGNGQFQVEDAPKHRRSAKTDAEG